MMKRIRADWTPTMKQRVNLGRRQVKWLIASEGHLWMRGYFDRFAPAMRRRLAESSLNICPACMDEEARWTAPGRPTISTYFAVIEMIERKLRDEPTTGN